MRVIKDLAYGPHGMRNLLDLYLPEGGRGPWPMVVGIHGGGWCSGRKEMYAWAGELLAQHGLAAATVNYRLWPQHVWPAALADVRRAVRWLRSRAKRYGLDTRRFGAFGSSAGGHLAAFLGLTDAPDTRDARLARFPSRVQCVADFYGPVDFPAVMKSASAPILVGLMGKPYEGHEADYRDASPVFHVGEGPPPFLIFHGELDVGTARGQVPMECSLALHEKLRGAGGRSTLVKVPGAGHGFATTLDGPQCAKAWRQTVRFFRNHLL